jgi:hypothetical protein
MLRRLVAYQPIHHLPGHLAGGGVIQVNERLALDLEPEDGKIRANALDIEHGSELRFQSRLYEFH